MNEKFVQFAAWEPDEEYLFMVCEQTALLSDEALAAALSCLSEQEQEEIFPLLFPAPVATGDRCVYGPVTQYQQDGISSLACIGYVRDNGARHDRVLSDVIFTLRS